jgi:hypothetical protein
MGIYNLLRMIVELMFFGRDVSSTWSKSVFGAPVRVRMLRTRMQLLMHGGWWAGVLRRDLPPTHLAGGAVQSPAELRGARGEAPRPAGPGNGGAICSVTRPVQHCAQRVFEVLRSAAGPTESLDKVLEPLPGVAAGTMV